MSESRARDHAGVGTGVTLALAALCAATGEARRALPCRCLARRSPRFNNLKLTAYFTENCIFVSVQVTEVQCHGDVRFVRIWAVGAHQLPSTSHYSSSAYEPDDSGEIRACCAVLARALEKLADTCLVLHRVRPQVADVRRIE